MPRSVDPDQRREEVAEAVVALACERGFAAVTIRSVAARMGASTTVVTHYVGSRSELIEAAVGAELDRFRSALEVATAGSDSETALRAFVLHAVHDAPDRTRRLWQATVREAQYDPVLRAQLRGFNAFWDAELRRLVTAVVGKGARTAHVVDAVDVVASGLASLSFEVPGWMAERGRERVERLVEEMIGAAVAGR